MCDMLGPNPKVCGLLAAGTFLLNVAKDICVVYILLSHRYGQNIHISIRLLHTCDCDAFQFKWPMSPLFWN